MNSSFSAPLRSLRLWATRRLWRLCADVTLSCVSFAIALSIYLDANNLNSFRFLTERTFLFGVVALVSFALTGLAFRSWRFVAIPDVIALVRDIGVAIAIFLSLQFTFNSAIQVPYSVSLVTFFVMIAALGGVRIAYRAAVEGMLAFPSKKTALVDGVYLLVYGATPETDAFLRSLQGGLAPGFHVVGIIDDDPHHADRRVCGVRVLGASGKLNEIIAQLNDAGARPDRLVVPAGVLSGDRLRDIVQAAAQSGLRVSRLPSASDLLKQAGAPFAFESLQITDILCREPVSLDLQSIDAMVRGKTVVVTGGGGSIGSELCRHLLMRMPAKLVIVDHSEFNLFVIQQELALLGEVTTIRAYLASVRDSKRIREIFEKENVDLVFHAAAYKHVPLVEHNPLEGIQTNVVGTANVADAAVAAGVAAMILVSTDKAVSPVNIMGLSKRSAEIYCQALDRECMAKNKPTRFIVVRFGNVLGSSGSVVPIFEEQIRRGGPVTVTHPEMTRFFMTIPEAVELMLQATAAGFVGSHWRGAIMVLDMGEPVRIVELAKRMIMLAGLVPDQDVMLKYVGLRPGEKLHEVLFDEGEKIEETDVAGIRLAHSQVPDYSRVAKVREMLLRLTREDDAARVRELLLSLLRNEQHDREWDGQEMLPGRGAANTSRIA
jgi:FlaA1/EpsC-like NDP-sugar epimerase